MSFGFALLFGEASSYEGGSFVVPCLTNGPKCELAISYISEILNNPEAKESFYAFMNSSIPLFSGLLSRDAVNVASGTGWFRQSDNQLFKGLLATLLWCAKNDPEYFVQAMGL